MASSLNTRIEELVSYFEARHSPARLSNSKFHGQLLHNKIALADFTKWKKLHPTIMPTPLLIPIIPITPTIDCSRNVALTQVPPVAPRTALSTLLKQVAPYRSSTPELDEPFDFPTPTPTLMRDTSLPLVDISPNKYSNITAALASSWFAQRPVAKFLQWLNRQLDKLGINKDLVNACIALAYDNINGYGKCL
ncbi:uncharacterized protein K444DRAFT_638511 [Hyaloscypha bicolor E]|uniref:Uncharacterized protein n=1 Tax=Hyaloscypha bicolor E TaxID=1095630 RepID=A0A2J6SGN0_9HELO|nr:uncharacterized protein K444DRAFT_638511 [Hyaloscypha bicolor E]PMD49932.1 hypothetical protein K444DRAFT_638511 [Hyaloscypha bicolor E]